MISPGEAIGVLGGGPIARMLTQAAQALGYDVHVFEPAGPSLAGAVANREVNAAYEDVAALKDFARHVKVITTEFEDIPSERLNLLAAAVPLHPRPEVLHVCQNRQRQRAWLRTNGFPQVRHAEALDGDIAGVIGQVGRPCVVKTADFGHDGQGQMKITDDGDLEKATAIFRGRRCMLERWMDFSCEVSVIVARSSAGETKVFPLAENIHTRNVLDFSIVPARVGAAVAREAEQLALAVAERLGVVGLMAVELFVFSNGQLLVNELAPRPHNSGHWSMEGCETSQFQQHIRAICGLPLGAVDVLQPTVMVNILTETGRWRRDASGASPRAGGGDPDWSAILRAPRAKLHLYGKAEPRPGRKVGHFTVRDADIETALVRAKDLKGQL